MLQSTHPRGCDPITSPPAVRTTPKRFNPHTREGVTNMIFPDVKIYSLQSTHPRGCDAITGLKPNNVTMLQSTHPRGCDWRVGKMQLLDILLQSTHPRGCDVGKLAHGVPQDSFNPHTREGVTGLGIHGGPVQGASIHTPARV